MVEPHSGSSFQARTLRAADLSPTWTVRRVSSNAPGRSAERYAKNAKGSGSEAVARMISPPAPVEGTSGPPCTLGRNPLGRIAVTLPPGSSGLPKAQIGKATMLGLMRRLRSGAPPGSGRSKVMRKATLCWKKTPSAKVTVTPMKSEPEVSRPTSSG